MFIVRFLGKVLTALWQGLNTLRRILQLVLLVGVFAILLAGVIGKPSPVPASAALVINPTGMLVEQLPGNDFDRAFAEVNGSAEPQTLLSEVTDSLEMAAEDDRIKLVLLDLDGLEGGGLAKLQAVGEKIKKVRAAGKKVIAMGNGYTRDQYYLASQGDEIIMHELGAVYLEGYEYYRTFYRTALDNLQIDLNIFRVGEFKSFVEPYIRDDMSLEDREASQAWVGSLWFAWEKDVAAGRKLKLGALQSYADELAARLEAEQGNGAQTAVVNGLVDKLMSRPQFNDYIKEIVGESEEEGGAFSAIDFRAYSRVAGLQQEAKATREQNVAVIVAAGEIVDGEAAPGMVGGDSLAAEVREARLDDSVAAVLLVIDSPGGSMFASEVIFDELEALKASGKPLVASMSTVAASGGYYIALLADEIWARDTTITGSIGVGALVPTVPRTLNKLGINVDGWGTTRLAGQMRIDRPLGDDARRVLTASVEDAYRIFVRKVAAARKMSFEEADSVARGRVWIGAKARTLGLVDHIGGVEEALKAAAAAAGLEEGTYGRRDLQPEQSMLQTLLAEIGVRALVAAQRLGLGHFFQGFSGPSSGPAGALLARFEAEVRALSRLNDPRGIYLHCDCLVE